MQNICLISSDILLVAVAYTEVYSVATVAPLPSLETQSLLKLIANGEIQRDLSSGDQLNYKFTQV